MKKRILLLSLLSLSAIAPAQEASDPFAKQAPQKKKAPPASKTENASAQNSYKVLSICYETFSLPLNDAAALQREGLSDALLYQKLLDGIEAGSTKQETFLVVRTRSGNLALTESITETIYPTEYEPGKVSNQLGVALSEPTDEDEPNPPVKDENLIRHPMIPKASELSDIKIPATPAAFDTRNCGVTLEIEAVIGANNDVFDLRLRPDHVFLVGRSKWGQDESLVEMPEFEASRLNTGIAASNGKPSLIGTINRPPNSKIDADSANKVWFAFVTPTIIEVRP